MLEYIFILKERESICLRIGGGITSIFSNCDKFSRKVCVILVEFLSILNAPPRNDDEFSKCFSKNVASSRFY